MSLLCENGIFFVYFLSFREIRDKKSAQQKNDFIFLEIDTIFQPKTKKREKFGLVTLATWHEIGFLLLLTT